MASNSSPDPFFNFDITNLSNIDYDIDIDPNQILLDANLLPPPSTTTATAASTTGVGLGSPTIAPPPVVATNVGVGSAPPPAVASTSTGVGTGRPVVARKAPRQPRQPRQPRTSTPTRQSTNNSNRSNRRNRPRDGTRMSQEELQRQLRLLSQDQVQAAAGRHIAGVTTTNTVTTTYKDGRRPSVRRSQSGVRT